MDESDGNYSRGDLSLREAIELANASVHVGVVDTVRFDPKLWATGPATVVLTHSELKITDSISIDGPGADLLTIDASGNDRTQNPGDGSRIFNIDNLNVQAVDPNRSGGHSIGATFVAKTFVYREEVEEQAAPTPAAAP